MAVVLSDQDVDKRIGTRGFESRHLHHMRFIAGFDSPSPRLITDELDEWSAVDGGVPASTLVDIDTDQPDNGNNSR